MHIMQSMFAGFLLIWIDMNRIGETFPTIMAERCIVIKGDLGVQRAQRLGRFVIRIADFCKRVDFHKRGVVLLEATPHFQQNLRGLINIGMIEADAFSHLGGRFQIEIVKSIDMQTLHGFRMLFGDFLNLSTAIRSGEHVEITRGSVH